jgi:hypothetical protein
MIELPFNTPRELEAAAEFIARLIEHTKAFTATVESGRLQIRFDD